MPNWCEGCLKIRGKKENINRFISQNLAIVHGAFDYVEEIPLKFEFIDDYEIEFLNENIAKESIYIRGTRRNFIELNDKYLDVDNKNDELIICFENTRSAWSFDANALRTISKKFDIDIKIYSFESGLQFNQDIEIIKGKIIKDECIEFQNYLWECINPIKGG